MSTQPKNYESTTTINNDMTTTAVAVRTEEQIPLHHAAAGGQRQQHHEAPLMITRADDGGSSVENNNNTHHRRPNRRPRCFRVRRKGVIPMIIVALVLVSLILFGIVVIFLSSGGGGGKNGSNPDDDINQVKKQYSQIATSYLNDNLNNNKEKKTSSSSTNVLPGCEGTVLILRHCDKYGIVKDSSKDDHCSYLGYERSQYISTLFGNEPDDRYPIPSFLYAMSEVRPNHNHDNYRFVETLEPLAEKLNSSTNNNDRNKKVKINTKYSCIDNANLAQDIYDHLREGSLCGKIAVISWRHNEIQTLAQYLGCGPYQGCPMDYPMETFDDIWELKFVFGASRPQKRSSSSSRLSSSSSTRSSSSSWQVFGTVVKQNFDPLKFSKEVGDYPVGGKETGGQWRNGGGG